MGSFQVNFKSVYIFFCPYIYAPDLTYPRMPSPFHFNLALENAIIPAPSKRRLRERACFISRRICIFVMPSASKTVTVPSRRLKK